MKQSHEICQHRNDIDYCPYCKKHETSMPWYKTWWYPRKCNSLGVKYTVLSVIWFFILYFDQSFIFIKHSTVKSSNIVKHFSKYAGSQLFTITIEIWHFLRDMDTQKLKNGLNNTISDHGIVGAVTLRCYGTDKVLENVVKHVFNRMFGDHLSAIL